MWSSMVLNNLLFQCIFQCIFQCKSESWKISLVQIFNFYIQHKKYQITDWQLNQSNVKKWPNLFNLANNVFTRKQKAHFKAVSQTIEHWKSCRLSNIKLYFYLTSSKYSINSKYMNIIEFKNLVITPRLVSNIEWKSSNKKVLFDDFEIMLLHALFFSVGLI